MGYCIVGKTEISYQELAIKLGMTAPGLIASWVSAFWAEGLKGLSRSKGCPSKMKNDKKKTEIHEKEMCPSPASHADIERIKALENQMLSL